MGTTSVVATRITNKSAPFIDGILEDVWQSAGKITFPNQASACFTLSNQSYDQLDPSTFTVYFLHDDINLYIAVQTLDDKMVESSDYDQNSDGLAGMAIEARDGSQRMYRLMWHQEKMAPCDSLFTGPPLDRDRMVFDAEWRSALRGSWNNNSDNDAGYTFEFSIPLKDAVAAPGVDGPKGLGGWKPGDQMRANIVLVDHDGKPGALFDDPAAAFRRCFWGSDKAEDLSVLRWIVLSNAPAQGEEGSDKSITAKRINPSAAPVINGSLDESIWHEAGKLRFPNSVGRTFTGSKARYNAADASSYTAYFLHDGSYLYVAVKAEDRMIESSACRKSGGCEDQASDGLISLAFEMKGGGGDRRFSTFWFFQDETAIGGKVDCEGKPLQNAQVRLRQGPPRYPYDTETVSWAPAIAGTWNNKGDVDSGYVFEYKIPLSGANGLGGYMAGDHIPANLVLADHDSNPAGSITECATNFKKFWWGFDGNEFYPPDNSGQKRFINPDEARSIFLEDSSPQGFEGSEEDAAKKAIDYIASQQVQFSGLIRSFPDEMAAHTYDNAVALIALTDADRRSGTH